MAATDWLQLAPFRHCFAGQKVANCNQPQSHALCVENKEYMNLDALLYKEKDATWYKGYRPIWDVAGIVFMGANLIYFLYYEEIPGKHGKIIATPMDSPGWYWTWVLVVSCGGIYFIYLSVRNYKKALAKLRSHSSDNSTIT